MLFNLIQDESILISSYTLICHKGKMPMVEAINGKTNVFALILSVTSPERMRKKVSLPTGNIFFL